MDWLLKRCGKIQRSTLLHSHHNGACPVKPTQCLGQRRYCIVACSTITLSHSGRNGTEQTKENACCADLHRVWAPRNKSMPVDAVLLNGQEAQINGNSPDAYAALELDRRWVLGSNGTENSLKDSGDLPCGVGRAYSIKFTILQQHVIGQSEIENVYSIINTPIRTLLCVRNRDIEGANMRTPGTGTSLVLAKM